MRVLVVDEGRIRRTWSRWLRPEGHEVSGCSTIREGARRLKREQTWDAILVELDLPDGRADKLLPHMSTEQARALVVLSASLTAGPTIDLLGKGMWAIPKPTTGAPLLDLVEHVNEWRKTRQWTPQERVRLWAGRHELSANQTQMLVLARGGLRDVHIATVLKWTERGVGMQWSQVFNKTGVRGRAAVIAAALA